MQPVLTPEAMARADRRTIESGTPVSVLMRRAGRAVAWRTRCMLGGRYGRRAVVVCGKGNNGGDGLVAAATFREWGIHTVVVELAGGVDREGFTRALGRADVAVDAMYGTGFRGSLEGDAALCAEELARFSGPVVAVDIPSGVDGLTGRARGPAVHATSTVTFAARKPGLLFEPGRALAGHVVVADIGVDLGEDGGACPPLAVLEPGDVRRLLPPRAPDTHKWRSGVFVVGGSGGMVGAPMFVAHAAMRAGAGIVWCGMPGGDAARRAAGGEVITRSLPAVPDGGLASAAAGEVLANAARFRALALGPGLGSGTGVAAAVRALVGQAPPPLVLDADGLNALAGDLDPLRARRDAGFATVLTPHEGEYARLSGEPVGDDRLAAARRLASSTGAVVLLKGPGTVVARPDGRAVVNDTGSAALATAGSGDVLTGIVAGFLARGVPAFEAAAAAAWVHGRAADRASDAVGPTGLVAGDLVAVLPSVLRDLVAPTAPSEDGT